MDKKLCTLITGACGGLGRAFVEILAKDKENLVLTGTSKKKLEQLENDFKEEFKDISVSSLMDLVHTHGTLGDTTSVTLLQDFSSNLYYSIKERPGRYSGQAF